MVTKVPKAQKDQILGQGEKATGTITIEINTALVKNTIEANKKQEDLNKAYMDSTKGALGPAKPLPHPEAPTSNAEDLGHELTHTDKLIENGSGGTENDATANAESMLSDQKAPDKEKAEDFVDRIIQPHGDSQKKPEKKP